MPTNIRANLEKLIEASETPSKVVTFLSESNIPYNEANILSLLFYFVISLRHMRGDIEALRIIATMFGVSLMTEEDIEHIEKSDLN